MTNETVPREWWEKLKDIFYREGGCAVDKKKAADNALQYALSDERWIVFKYMIEEMRRIEQGEK